MVGSGGGGEKVRHAVQAGVRGTCPPTVVVRQQGGTRQAGVQGRKCPRRQNRQVAVVGRAEVEGRAGVEAGGSSSSKGGRKGSGRHGRVRRREYQR